MSPDIFVIDGMMIGFGAVFIRFEKAGKEYTANTVSQLPFATQFSTRSSAIRALDKHRESLENAGVTGLPVDKDAVKCLSKKTDYIHVDPTRSAVNAVYTLLGPGVEVEAEDDIEINEIEENDEVEEPDIYADDD